MNLSKILTRNIGRLGSYIESGPISQNTAGTFFFSICRRHSAVISRPLVNKSSLVSSSSSISSSSFHTSSLVLSFGRTSRDVVNDEDKEKDPTRREIGYKREYQPVDLETSKEYLKSEAFAKTYGGLPIWHESLYRLVDFLLSVLHESLYSATGLWTSYCP